VWAYSWKMEGGWSQKMLWYVTTEAFKEVSMKNAAEYESNIKKAKLK
jgi:hypothetical protein